MHVTLHGAAGGEVTGSAYHIHTDDADLLLDFGMFQGVDEADQLNRIPKGLDVASLDAVVLTHAHLDHTGRLPLLARAGFTGPIHCTPATIEMTGLILRDSAKVQAQDIERHNRKRALAGKDPLQPLYDQSHVETILGTFRSVPYDQPVPVAPGIEARFVEAGHMLGSTSIQLSITEKSRKITVVFSGDIGPRNVPILKDAEPFHKAAVVFLESTYGDRDHKPFAETAEEFLSIIRQVVERKGKILVPTFAVGRAQLLLTLLAWAFEEHKIPPFPVYVDSPMAAEATRIYQAHPELFDEESKEFFRTARNPVCMGMPHCNITATADESRKLNDLAGPCMILAGSGMCNAGRILHHLRQNLSKTETAVLIVGFQGEGTLGRQLVDGKKEVSIFGEKIAVRATVHTLGGFSAHAAQTELLQWFGAMSESRPRVYLTHGEDRARQPLADKIHARWLLRPQLPRLGETIEL
jgi:metallo-beta-lactamase family protein